MRKAYTDIKEQV